MKQIIKSRLALLALPVAGAFLGIWLEKNYWLWLLAIPMPVVSMLAACRPSKVNNLTPVESQDIFKELNGIN